MQIPVPVSYIAPLVPIAIRAGIGALFWRVAPRLLGPTRRTEEHRTLTVALAGFSLAGLAIIGTQGGDKFKQPFFDITLSFLCYVGSLGVQGWRARWWQDALGDALRDAATTAMLLFIVRLTIAVAPGLGWSGRQLDVVIAVAALAWFVDPGFPLAISAQVWKGEHDRGKTANIDEASRAQGAEGSPQAGR